MNKLYFFLVLLLVCCSSDDSKESCEDGYWVSYFQSCETNQPFDVIYVSVDEGNRLTNVIYNTEENCVEIEGIDLSGKAFSGFYIKDFSGDLELWDCSEQCIGCFGLK